MKTSQKTKRGPQTGYVLDHENNPVVGLRIQKTKDANKNTFERYYAVIEENAKSSRKLFGSSKDKPAAIEAYRRWQLKKNREIVSVGSRLDDVEQHIKDEIGAGQKDIELTVELDGETYTETDVPASAFWDLVRRLINETPKLVAQKTGIEQIGYLDKLEPPKPSPKLNALLDEYLKRVSLSESEERNTITWWREFCSIVDAKTVKQLNFHQFLKYSDRISKDQTSKQRTAYYVRNRIIAIQKIINSAAKYRLIEANEIERIHDEWKEPLKKPAIEDAEIFTFKPDEFLKLYEASETTRDRCILLLGMNCAYYPIDLTRLRWKHIYFDRGAIEFRRQKKNSNGKQGTFRIAVMWEETAKQLRALQREYELNGIDLDEDRPVFVHYEKGQWINIQGKNTFSNRFNEIRRKTKINKKIRFRNLRDSVATRGAVLGWTPQYQILLGHQVDSKSDNKYVERAIDNVRPLCNAVAEYYGFK